MFYFSLSPNGTRAYAAFTSGNWYENLGTSWTIRNNTLRPTALKAVTANAVAGANGEIYIKTNDGWQYQPHFRGSIDFTQAAQSTGDLYLSSGNVLYRYVNAQLSQGEGLPDNITALSAIGSSVTVGTVTGAIFDGTTLAFNNGNTSPIAAVDAKGLAGGTAGRLWYKNTTWLAAQMPKLQPLNALAYGTNNTIYAVGNQGTTVRSTDNGASWKLTYSGITQNLLSVATFGSNAIAGGVGVAIYFQNNTWNKALGIPANGTVRAVAMNGTKAIALVDKNIYESADQGKTYSLKQAIPEIGYGVSLDADGYGMVVGDKGLAYRIAGLPAGQAGGIYTLIPTDATPTDDKGTGLPVADFRTVQFTDRLSGYITGTNGLVLKTTDGGNHWQKEDAGSGTATPIVAISNGTQGTLLNADGTVQSLNDQAGKYSSRFWYDEIGRLVLSQNSKQYSIAKYLSATEQTAIPNTGTVRAYSYTLYDEIGRIREVGELLTRSQPQTNNYESQVLYENFATTFVPTGTKRELTRTYYDEVAFENLQADFKQENLRPRVASVTYQDLDGTAYDRATHYSYDVHGNVKALIQELVTPTPLKKRIDYDYDLISGKVNQVSYQKGEADQFLHQYQYDGDNRITKVLTSKDGVEWEQDAKYDYYAHGPLARTTLGENKVETQNYAYTLQGWMKGVQGQNFSYALGYHDQDYASIGASASLLSTPVTKNLYNGNIATMASRTPALGTTALAQQYGYDQLNRIKESTTLNGSNSFKTTYDYDANGNITKLQRYDVGGKLFDDLMYHYHNVGSGYKEHTNKLRWVDDNANQVGVTEDIKDQAADNYDYDQIGNLTKDDKEEIKEITWTVYGKVKTVTRTTISKRPSLHFAYDASGNRVSKKVIPKIGSTTTTYYIRDASGNPMAVYEQTAQDPVLTSEYHLYGSSRLGIVRVRNSSNLDVYRSTIGLKEFELTDHLGNVRAVVNDIAAVQNATDYLPFGMAMPGRRMIGASGYRYGFNGQEKDDEIAGAGNSYTAEYWQYDSRLGRRWNLDPKPNPSISNYACFANNPIWNNDIFGDTLEIANNTASRDDINRIVKPKNVGLISYDGNKLSINFGSLSDKDKAKKLKRDKGLRLLNDMSNAPERILFETTDQTLEMRNRMNPAQTHFLENPSTIAQNNVMNMSITPRNIDGGEGPADHVPFNPYYQGHVAIRPGSYTNTVGVYENGEKVRTFMLTIPRASLIFHELYENYERTHCKQPYERSNGTGAHKFAIDAAGNSFGLSKDQQGNAQTYTP